MKNWKNKIAPLVFLAPWIVGFLILTLLPMAMSLYFSFTNYNLLTPPKFIGLSNYVKMFTTDKLIEMMHLNETLFSCGIACSATGTETESGNYLIDMLLANVCKQNVTRFPYEISRLAEDIAGGLMVTMPSEKDFKSEEIGKYCRKYFKGNDRFDTLERMKLLRLIENMTLGAAAVGYRTESMHGAGSPQAQRIMISRQGKLNEKKKLARQILDL